MHVLKIPHGVAGTAHTVASIIALIRDPDRIPEMRRYALWITRGVAGNRKEDLCEAIYNWVSERVRYRSDPDGVEFVSEPLKIANLAYRGDWEAAEDCDGHSVLVGSLCFCLGIPVRFCLSEDFSNQAPEGEEPRWAHIHVEAECEGGWMPLDTALSDWVPYRGRVKASKRSFIYVWDVTSDDVEKAYKKRHKGLGFVGELVTGTAGVITSYLGYRSTKKLAKASKEAALINAQATLQYQEKLAELDAAVQTYDSELQAKIDMEQSELRKNKISAWIDTLFAVGIAGGGIYYLTKKKG